MKFSEKWLREWVNPNVTTQELADKLTMAGLEVDAVEAVAPAFSGVVVGKIVSFEKHPNADKLNLCQVDTGDGELASIICGAPNVRQDMIVACAKIGAVLPGDFKIKKAKLRGVESFGMLCSAKELGLNEEHDGILDLPADLQIGQDIKQALELDDMCIDVDLTPNRGDCLGIRGIAREVGVQNNCDVTEVKVAAVAPSIDDTLEIDVQAPADCPRYLGRVVKNVNASAKTPAWMVKKLERSGIRPINPIVDVTNYVLLELGHPMHAFDLKQIDRGIVVRRANPQEKLVLLDGGQEVELTSETLLIADHSKPLAIAGVMGGEHSGVDDKTTDILLESAFFAPLAIAGKARSYGLHTDASHRYERGVDPYLQRTAMERATQLVLDIVGGEAGPIVEAVSEKHLPVKKPISINLKKINQLIGFDFPQDTVENIFKRLGMHVEANEGGWLVTAPSYRFDIEIAEDLVEELVRVFGYNNIPTIAPVADLKMVAQPESKLQVNRIKHFMADLGYQEAISYTFVAPELQQAFYGKDGLALLNPISADLAVMREGMWPSLAAIAKYNLNRQQSRVRIFETGLRFVSGDALTQEPVIGGLICGLAEPEQWGVSKRPVDFYDIKGDVERLLASCGKSAQLTMSAGQHNALHPGQTAAIMSSTEVVGHVGCIHPSVAKKVGLPAKVYLFELKLDALDQQAIPAFHELSKFPTTRRDLALTAAIDFPADKLVTAIKQNGGDKLLDVQLFDVYTGEGVSEGQKSIALGLTFGDHCRNLKDEEINADIDKLLLSLENNYSVMLRE